MSTKEIAAAVRELKRLQAKIEAAEKQAAAIKDAIKAHMGDAEQLSVGQHKITWQTVTTARIDTGALKQAMPEVAAAFTRESTSRRFTVA